tara:strand:- start:165 stop:353 length:189 start_codon:yes stop_codon:yes gene_type:complete
MSNMSNDEVREDIFTRLGELTVNEFCAMCDKYGVEITSDIDGAMLELVDRKAEEREGVSNES